MTSRPGPATLGPYQLLRLLGEGGMGAVHLARDPSGTLVAIKVIKAEHARDPGFRARFRSEVNRAREVPPFCTAEVLDADPDHETPYLVVEYVDGPNLGELIRQQGPLRGGSLHSVAVGVASALVAIHSAGIVHRDLKPANVLFSLGSPKVIDFGIAKALEATSHHTQGQEVLGTLSYMAPERFAPGADQNLTPAADVFAWGAIVAYAASGRNPFAGDNPAATAGRILTQAPDLTALPPSLAGIVERALAKDPAQRPTARDLLLELTAGPLSEDSTVRLRGAASPLRGAASRLRGAASRLRGAASHGTGGRVIASAAVAVLLTVGGAFAGSRLGQRSTSTTAAAPSPSVRISTVAPGPVPTATLSAGGLFDPLTTAALWKPFRSDSGTCDFSGGLVVRTAAEVDCDSGPSRAFKGDTHIEVRAEISAGACAYVKFRYDEAGQNGYHVIVCATHVSVQFRNDGRFDHADIRNSDEGNLPELDIEENGPHLIKVDIVRGVAKVTVAGKRVLTSDLSRGRESGPRHKSGLITFGASAYNIPAGQVTFRDARVTVDQA
ncbi:serine/threonine-protein kinase [Actinoplanes couchii]|uniref:Protein kinase domain-containing protein n=1 Tax=Actinoplanes couchii TaxID=403638 RepID=A0ABQ3XFJ1_9ACTN|nr:serine/threonine-protein kinase [Actinoplanes couchii]MDR6321781.1 putative Ser/Thr protein kinase [Actinoplanes couchii]GID57261.1 hypothetical protein Aco03nite_056650 [Actinoplanes couchii]